MGGQESLFYDDVRCDSGSGDLILLSRPDRPLSKSQRTFNRLVARVESLRTRLQSETRRLDQALALRSASSPAAGASDSTAERLCSPLLVVSEPEAVETANRPKSATMVIADHLEEIMTQEGSLADDDLRVLFKRIHGIDFQRAEREGFEERRSAIEDLFADAGIDIDLGDLEPGMSEAAIAAKIAEMAGSIQEKIKNEEDKMHRPGQGRTRQLAKEERMRQAEEVRSKSIASIYKQLAKALHPDLEPDDGRRRRKVALMQELTTAYRDNDLHTLLRLELEWIQREETGLDRLTDQKLSIYNQVLREQVRELEEELAALPYHPRYHPLVVPDGPFEIRLRTNGPAEAHELDRTIASMEASIGRMRNGEGLPSPAGGL